MDKILGYLWVMPEKVRKCLSATSQNNYFGCIKSTILKEFHLIQQLLFFSHPLSKEIRINNSIMSMCSMLSFVSPFCRSPGPFTRLCMCSILRINEVVLMIHAHHKYVWTYSYHQLLSYFKNSSKFHDFSLFLTIFNTYRVSRQMPRKSIVPTRARRILSKLARDSSNK